MKVGLIGAGRIGTRHASTLATLPAVDTAICDAVPERALELANSVRDARVMDLDCPPPITTMHIGNFVSQRQATGKRTGPC